MDEAEIPKFYAGKKVLVTGASGFIGKILVWKLLKSCPNVDTIYVLLRSKYGKSAGHRREKMLSYVIFDNFRKECPEMLLKVVAVAGDVGEVNLGLSERDRRMLINEVSVVFNSAAILKMDADIRSAVNVNTQGTMRLLDLSVEMKKLDVFVQISTAYCCCEEETIAEKIYPPKDDPYTIINYVNNTNKEELAERTPSLIEPLPNTYTYSKRLTEVILPSYQNKLPIVVARPTIVIPSWKEPIPGWNDNLNGPTGIMIAIGRGVLRSMLSSLETMPDFIPADIATNGIISLPWSVCKEKKCETGEIPVYNLGISHENRVSWHDVFEIGFETLQKYPPAYMLWVPTRHVFRTNVYMHWLITFLFQWIPAYLIDGLLFLAGQKTFMIRVQTKIQHGLKVLQYFAHHQWYFDTNNIKRISRSMTGKDRELFPVTTEGVTNYQEYFDNAVKISKQYIMKEDLKDLPSCKRMYLIMYYLDYFVKVALCFFVFRLIFNYVYSFLASYN